MLSYLRSVAARSLRLLTGRKNAGVPSLQTFKYLKPGDADKGIKEVVLLSKTSSMRVAVHIIRKGAEEHLHSHKTIDGFWMVLRGKVRFYGDNDTNIGEFGPYEGVLTPRHTRYRFESVGDQDAEMLQVLSFSPREGMQRDDHDTPKFAKHDMKWFDGRISK